MTATTDGTLSVVHNAFTALLAGHKYSFAGLEGNQSTYTVLITIWMAICIHRVHLFGTSRKNTCALLVLVLPQLSDGCDFTLMAVTLL